MKGSIILYLKPNKNEISILQLVEILHIS